MSVRSILQTLAVAALAACSSSTDGGGGPAAHLQVTPAVINLAVPGTQQLTVSVLDDLGATLNLPVTFTSSDTSVARVNTTGLVTTFAPGVVSITVSSGTATAVVVPLVASNNIVTVTVDTTFITGAQSAHLTAIVKNGAGATVTAPVTFTARDTSVFATGATGTVTRKTSGSVYVVAASGGGRDSVRITAVVARLPVTRTPFAVVMLSGGAAFVTRLDTATVYRLNLGAMTGAASVAVGSTPSSIALNKAGTQAYVGNQGSNSVSVINPASDAVTSTLNFSGTVLSVGVPPGDSLLLVGTDNGKLYIVRLASLTVSDSIPVPSYTNSLAFRGDTTVFANSVAAGTVAEINLRTRTVVRTLTIGGIPQALLVSANGSQLYVANEVGQLQIWNLASGTLVNGIPLPGGGGFSLARNPATGLLYVGTSYFGQRIHVIDPVSQTIVRTILTGGTVRRIAFLPDGSIGIAANEAGWVDFIK